MTSGHPVNHTTLTDATTARQICAVYRKQFYGSDRAAYRAKIDLLKRLWKEGLFKGWIALVTNDFYAKIDNLTEARDAGCVELFSGTESLDEEQLERYGKKQNIAVPQLGAIEDCLNSGIIYQYGMVFDLATQPLDVMRKQLNFAIDYDRIPLSAFVSGTIPLLGTPEFDRVVANGLMMPNVRLRDMDGATLVAHTLDPVDSVIEFIRQFKNLSWAKRKIAGRSLRFLRRYRKSLSTIQMANMLGNGARLCLPSPNRSNANLVPQRKVTETRTYLSTTQPLSALYDPIIPLRSDLRGHFESTVITDNNGRLHPSILADLSPVPVMSTRVKPEVQSPK